MARGRVTKTNQCGMTKLRRIEAREEHRITVNGWKAQLPDDSRHRIANKIMETLKKHAPVSGPDVSKELMKGAVRFEKKVYSSATSQQDYLRKITLRMLTVVTKSQNQTLLSKPFGNSVKPPEPDTGEITG